MKQNLIDRNIPAECRKNDSGLRKFSAGCVAKLNQLKETVAEKLAAEFNGLLDERRIRQVVNDADALASVTPFPALFLPALAEEKVLAVAAWQRKQQSLRPGQNGAFAFAA